MVYVGKVMSCTLPIDKRITSKNSVIVELVESTRTTHVQCSGHSIPLISAFLAAVANMIIRLKDTVREFLDHSMVEELHFDSGTDLLT